MDCPGTARLSVPAVLISFIAPKIEVSQRWALPQHSRNILCPDCSEIKVSTEIKVPRDTDPVFEPALLEASLAERLVLNVCV